jgi:hypothetical protein
LIDMPAPELLLTHSDCSSKPGEYSKINLNVSPGEAHFDHLLFCSSFFDVDWRMGKIRQRTSCNSMTDEEDIGWPGSKNDWVAVLFLHFWAGLQKVNRKAESQLGSK